MNKKLPVHFFFSILFFLLMLELPYEAKAQSSELFFQNSILDFRDSREHSFYTNDRDTISDKELTLAGLGNVEYRFIKSDAIFVFKYSHDVNAFIDSTKSSPPFQLDKIDFRKNALVLFSYHGGDCHARFQFRYSQDDEAKVLTVKVYDFYGGCRAGGNFFTNWAVIPKLPEDYKIEFTQVMVDM